MAVNDGDTQHENASENFERLAVGESDVAIVSYSVNCPAKILSFTIHALILGYTFTEWA